MSACVRARRPWIIHGAEPWQSRSSGDQKFRAPQPISLVNFPPAHMQPLVQKQHRGWNYPAPKYVGADAAADTGAVCGDPLFPRVFCKRLIYVCRIVCAQISRYFLWPPLSSCRLSFLHLKGSLSSPLWKWAIFFEGLSDAAEDAGEVLVLPPQLQIPALFSRGTHSRIPMISHGPPAPPALIWEICWCLPPLQGFFFF